MVTGKRRMALRVAGIVVGVVVLVIVGWFAWVKQPSAPSAALQATLHTLVSRPCTGLQVVGVRGHSDPPNEVGPDVSALILRLRARLSQDSQTDVVSLPYEQGPNLGIVPLWVPRDITNGAHTLEDYLRARTAACRGGAASRDRTERRSGAGAPGLSPYCGMGASHDAARRSTAPQRHRLRRESRADFQRVSRPLDGHGDRRW